MPPAGSSALAGGFHRGAGAIPHRRQQTKGFPMSKRKRPKPVIGLTTLACSVQTSPSGTSTFLDVTFKCSFAADAKPVEGTSISIKKKEWRSVERLAEASYLDIFKLLAEQQRAYPMRK
jgi:hypothetical protein